MAAGQRCVRQGAAVRNLQAAVAVAKMEAFQQASSFEQLFSRLVADVPHIYCCSGFSMGCTSAVAVVQHIHRQLATTPVPRGAGL